MCLRRMSCAVIGCRTGTTLAELGSGSNSCSNQHGRLFDLAVDRASRFIRLALEVDEARDGLALAPTLGRKELRADPVGPLVEPETLEPEQAAIDGVRDPLRADVGEVR